MVMANDAESAREDTSPELITKESDADLLTLISWRQEDSESAQAAFIEFYLRHAPFLHKACERKLGDRLPLYYSVEDLVGDTFLRVMERAAGTFDAGDEKDHQRLRWLTRAWLFTIAGNILQDVYRGRPTAETTVSPGDLDQQSAPPPLDESQATRLTQQAMDAALEERERDVLATTMLWLKHGAKYQRLPNDVAADLAGRWGTSSENLRKIRASAIAKVKAFLIEAGIEKHMNW